MMSLRHKAEFLQIHHRLRGAGEEVNLLFLGYLGTIFYTLPYLMWGDVPVYLPLPDKTVYLDSILWCVGMNLNTAILWYVLFRMSGHEVYKFISALYVFAVVEMFVVWDKAWFFVLGVPITSNVFIFIGFIYAYYGSRNNYT